MSNVFRRGSRAKLEEMMRLVTRLPGWMPRLGYYGSALLFVAAAALLRWGLRDVLTPAPTLVFYLAWVGAAAFGGLGPGLLATAASWLCIDLFFDSTPGQIGFTDPTSLGRLVVLLIGGLVVSVVGERMRRARIRERRQVQELAVANAALGESEERLRQRVEEVETLMDLIPAAIWVAHDPRCNHIVGNQAANSFYEVQGQENVSANVSPVRRFFRDGQELKAEELPMQEAAAGNIDIRNTELDVLLPSGTRRNMLGSASPLHDGQGRVRGCIGAFMDITARKQAEQALRERMKELACLYAVNRDKQEDLSLDELCRRAVEHLVPALQFPEITVPVIELSGKRFTTENYAAGLSHGLDAAIRVDGEILGHLTVYYTQERPFLIPEEQNLVNGVAEALSTWLVRQRAEVALRESEARLRVALDAGRMGTWVWDLATDTVDTDHLHRRLWDLDDADVRVPARVILQKVHPADRARTFDRESAQHMVTGPFDTEFRVRRRDGSLTWLQGAAVPVRDAGGVLRKIVGVNFDITERKEAEEALRRSEQQFKSTFENAAIGIAHVALDGHILQFNSRFCAIAGYPCADLLGKTCEQITLADDWQAERAQMQRLLDGAVAHYAIEKRYHRVDGSLVWVNLTRSIQRDDAGTPEYFIVLVEDISARKRAEEALRELTATLESKVAQRTTELKHRAIQLQKLALDMSEAEDRERRRLAEILHDDLQQVLAAAKFQLGLIRQRAEQDTSLQETTTQIDHLLKDAIGKSRSLSHELSPAVLHHDDFTEVLRWLASQVQAKHGLVVHVSAPGPVRSQSEAIKAFLYRTAQEMLFNVVKHGRVNEARMRVRQLGRCICLSVSDHGRGFDPHELGETTGFGLLSIRERIELLGGRMRIKSAKAKGSTFFIVVPDGEIRATGPEADRGSEGRGKGAGRGARQESRRLRVLLADDHEIVRQGLVALLSEEHTVEIVGEAANGREAVDLADRLEPDAIIMDVSMPLIDGDEATRQIKTHRPRTRVIALSMHDEPETMANMYRAGAESYVLKTASSEELLAALRGKESDS
jgi:PAS domain S-box-containing protein